MARRLDFHSANFAADFDALLDSKRESIAMFLMRLLRSLSIFAIMAIRLCWR